MEIKKPALIATTAKTLSIYCKVSDRFCANLLSDKGEVVHEQDDGYVPDFMPGQHYGDYVILDIDLASGQVVNWTPPSAEEIEVWIKGDED
jgi:hypothetical protein